jgi:peptide chain release factor 1
MLAAQFLQWEPGGHRVQRVPPTEKRGRVHSSTVTVAVLEPRQKVDVQLRDRDLDFAISRSGGPGGQHANKTSSAVQVTHLPTGISVRCESERSQPQNKRTALELLQAKLQEREATSVTGTRRSKRRRQVGTGARSDKVLTMAFQRGVAQHHTSKQKVRLKDYLAGDIDLLWG